MTTLSSPTEAQDVGDLVQPPPVCVRKAGGRPNWIPMFAIILIHLGALLAFVPAFLSWKAVLTAVVLYAVCVMSVTVGFHRLLTHRSFQTGTNHGVRRPSLFESRGASRYDRGLRSEEWGIPV